MAEGRMSWGSVVPEMEMEPPSIEPSHAGDKEIAQAHYKVGWRHKIP